MMETLILIGFGVWGLYQLRGTMAENAPADKGLLMPIYTDNEKQYDLPAGLLRAIAKVESSENPNAVNPADPSYGLMQLLYPNNLPSVPDWPPPNKEALFNPRLNVHYAAQILKWNIDNYGVLRGIAIYNCWEARHSPEEGPFPNQDYVDRVMDKWGNAYKYIMDDLLS